MKSTHSSAGVTMTTLDDDDAAALMAEAVKLLAAHRRSGWRQADADEAWSLVPALIDEGLSDLADRLILALERFNARPKRRRANND